ncbi:hypothetical protein D3C80_2165550 [compost metagenome]
MPQTRIQPLLREQLGMAAHLGNPAFFQHHQAVHAGDGRQPVGDGDHGLALHQGLEAFLNCCFDFRVQC